MSIAYKILGQSNPSADTPTTLYTVPGSNNAIISTITIANLSSNAASFRISCRPAGASLANSHYISYDTPVSPNDTVGLTLGITLAATDVVTVSANTGNVNFSAFGMENF